MSGKEDKKKIGLDVKIRPFREPRRKPKREEEKRK